MRSLRDEERAHRPAIPILFLNVLFLGLISCAIVASPPTDPPEPSPTVSRDTNELVESLTKRLDQFRSLRALASVSYSGREGRKGFQEAVVVRRPDHLRLETLSPLGAILIVTVNGREIAGLHPREGLFFRGQSHKENILRYTQVPLELNELTSLLMGLPPVEMGDSWKGDGNSISSHPRGGPKNLVLFDAKSLVPTKWERTRPEGKIELSATFSDYLPTPAGLFASRIVVEAPEQGRRLEIHYQEPELNVALPVDLFVQEKPGYAKELPIESLGG